MATYRWKSPCPVGARCRRPLSGNEVPARGAVGSAQAARDNATNGMKMRRCIRSSSKGVTQGRFRGERPAVARRRLLYRRAQPFVSKVGGCDGSVKLLVCPNHDKRGQTK